MNDIPDIDRTRNLLSNWSIWARDCPPDAAEVYYYTVSPMFADIMKQGSLPPYDIDSAMMVEEVMRRMFRPYRNEYRVLQAYYGEGLTQKEIAKELGIARQSVGRHRLPMAHRIFSEQWALLIRRA